MDSVLYVINSNEPIILKDITIFSSSLLDNNQENIEKVIIGSSVKILEDYCFTGCINMTTIFINGSVSHIGSNCFDMCNNLNEVMIARGVKILGESCFKGCKSLTHIKLPLSITHINSKCFEDCINLQEISIQKQKNIVYCGDNVFKNINRNVNITFNCTIGYYYLNESMKYLITQNYNSNDPFCLAYKYVNENNSKFFDFDEFKIQYKDNSVLGMMNKFKSTSTRVISSIDTIDDFTSLYNASSSVNLSSDNNNITDGKTYLKFNSIVNSQENLIYIVIGTSVRNINTTFFSNCTNLKYIYFNGDLKNKFIGFLNCKKLEKIKIPTNISYLYSDYFNGCINLVNIDYSGNIISYYDNGCFNNCSSLRNFTIPSTINFIGRYCFSNCVNLTSLLISSTTIKIIPRGAFSLCSSLTSISIPDAVKHIDEFAFSGCTSLSNFTLPVAYAEKGLFLDCTNLTSVKFNKASTTTSNNLTYSIINYIGKYAFMGCTKLLNILTAPNTIPCVEEIRNYAFSGCTVLTSAEFIQTYTTFIGNNAFSNCTNLTSVLLYCNPGSYCFFNCTKMTLIYLKFGVNIINEYCFARCTSINNIVFSNNVSLKEIKENAFNSCSSITELTIPDSVSIVGDGCFANCSNLLNISFSNKITALPKNCFNRCYSLTSFTIDTTVLSIGSFCFDGCVSLTSLTIPESVTSLGLWCFSRYASNASSIIGSKFNSIDSNYGHYPTKDLDITFNNQSTIKIIENDDTLTQSILGSVFYSADAAKTAADAAKTAADKAKTAADATFVAADKAKTAAAAAATADATKLAYIIDSLKNTNIKDIVSNAVKTEYSKYFSEDKIIYTGNFHKDAGESSLTFLTDFIKNLNTTTAYNAAATATTTAYNAAATAATAAATAATAAKTAADKAKTVADKAKTAATAKTTAATAAKTAAYADYKTAIAAAKTAAATAATATTTAAAAAKTADDAAKTATSSNDFSSYFNNYITKDSKSLYDRIFAFYNYRINNSSFSAGVKEDELKNMGNAASQAYSNAIRNAAAAAAATAATTANPTAAAATDAATAAATAAAFSSKQASASASASAAFSSYPLFKMIPMPVNITFTGVSGPSSLNKIVKDKIYDIYNSDLYVNFIFSPSK